MGQVAIREYYQLFNRLNFLIMRNITRFFLTLSMAFAGMGVSLAQSYVAVNTDTKVFDQASAQGYVTQNQQGQNVVLSPGMAFKTTDSTPGWDVIEYTPGLRGYIMKTNEVSPSALKAPTPGSYKVSNDSSTTLVISDKAGVWSASAGNVSYSGKMYGNIVVFYAKNGNQAYTLLDYGNGPVVMSYNNKITKFF